MVGILQTLTRVWQPSNNCKVGKASRKNIPSSFKRLWALQVPSLQNKVNWDNWNDGIIVLIVIIVIIGWLGWMGWLEWLGWKWGEWGEWGDWGDWGEWGELGDWAEFRNSMNTWSQEQEQDNTQGKTQFSGQIFNARFTCFDLPSCICQL